MCEKWSNRKIKSFSRARRAELGVGKKSRKNSPAVKTMEGWNQSGKYLSDYLQPGDEIDESLMNYFLSVLPPQTWTRDMIQIGEPHSSNSIGYTYATIERDTKYSPWRYTGNKNTPEDMQRDIHRQAAERKKA